MLVATPVPRTARIHDECLISSALCSLTEPRGLQQDANQHHLRDTLLYRFWFLGTLPQDLGEKWLPCAAMGALHHTER